MRQVTSVSEINSGDHVLITDAPGKQWIGIVHSDGEHMSCKMGWWDLWNEKPVGFYPLHIVFEVEGATVHVLEDEDPYDFHLVRQAKIALGVAP